jgi:DNA helicase IV
VGDARLDAVDDARDEAIREEQEHVDRAYARLEELRARADRRRREALAAPVTTHADLVNRDASAHEAAARVRSLTLGDTEPLVFGRIDLADGVRHHIGRVSVLSQDYDPLVVDWRSDAAVPFYRATPGEPDGVRRRRVIQCRGRTVLTVEDQLLQITADVADEEPLVGDAALMAAVTQDRSETMRDIVATIQREQDEIIRLPARGLVAVTGGPGTGKTAVALHRVAYLLHQHRQRLETRGVLIVGPSRAFGEYIRGVLPSLGETRAVVLPLGAFAPGLRTDRHDPLDVAAVKGDVRLAEVARRSARDLPAGSSWRAAFRRLRDDPSLLRRAAESVLDDDESELIARSWAGDRGAGHPPSVEDIPIIEELRHGLGHTPREGLVRRDDGPPTDEVTTFAERETAVDPGEVITRPGYSAFGHVVIDEAQDLTPMQWRMVARRGREASWTIVGDLAQRSSPVTPDDWDEIARLLSQRAAEVRRLSVNYRTSPQIMELAGRLLPAIAPGRRPPRSVRPSDEEPRVVTGVDDLAGAAGAAARAAHERVSGTIAVIAPTPRVPEVTPHLDRSRAKVLGPWEAKGLEFDAVVVAAPEEIVAEVGLGGLYVALTRATHDLAVVTSAPDLPGPLSEGT